MEDDKYPQRCNKAGQELKMCSGQSDMAGSPNTRALHAPGDPRIAGPPVITKYIPLEVECSLTVLSGDIHKRRITMKNPVSMFGCRLQNRLPLRKYGLRVIGKMMLAIAQCLSFGEISQDAVNPGGL